MRSAVPVRGGRSPLAFGITSLMTPQCLVAAPLKSAMMSAFVQQAAILVLASMILDGGLIHQICFYAFAAFWGGVGIILIRRCESPTKLDLVFVRGGYLVVCIISFFLTSTIWSWRGF